MEAESPLSRHSIGKTGHGNLDLVIADVISSRASGQIAEHEEPPGMPRLRRGEIHSLFAPEILEDGFVKVGAGGTSAWFVKMSPAPRLYVDPVSFPASVSPAIPVMA